MTDEEQIERFWSKVERRASDECWPWLGSTGKNGRGNFRYQGAGRNAPRVALALAHGIDVPPKDIFACHTCDNPPCCNPAHLWWGDVKQNNHDASLKGRHHTTLKTHCPRGHPYAGDNLSVSRGWRSCKACKALSMRGVRARRKLRRQEAADA